MWSKLLVNAAINPLTALLECRTGGLLTDSALPLVRDVCFGSEIDGIGRQ